MFQQYVHSLRAITILGILAACLPAQAIDRYVRKDLPHLGFGGEASSWREKADAEGLMAVIGRVGTSNGSQQAALWLSDGMGAFSLTLLPGTGGPNSRANGIVFDDGTGPHIVGAAQTPNGTWKPVLWSVKVDGIVGPETLATLGGAGGSAADARRCAYPLCGGVWIVGRSQTEDGSFHATAWHRDGSGVVETHDLGTLGGAESEATALSIDREGGVVVVGRSQTSTGEVHGMACFVTNYGVAARSDLHPGGVASGLTGIAIYYNENELGLGRTVASGTARLATGRSMGILYNGHAGLGDNLTVSGFHNTSTTGIVGTRYGALITGSAWDNPLNTQAVVWNSVASIGTTRAYPASALVDHPLADDIAFVTEVSSRAMVGAFLDEYVEGGMEPLALIADGTEMPDVVTVPLGQPENHFSEMDLWHEGDGRTLRIRSQNNQGDRAVVETSFYEDENQDGDFEDRGERRMSVRTRVLGSPHATARVGVQVFNFSLSQWDDVGVPYVFSLKYEDFQSIVAAGNHINSATGEVRVRLMFSPLAKGIQGYEIDRVSLSRAL
jgi:hypothetical protein